MRFVVANILSLIAQNFLKLSTYQKNERVKDHLNCLNPNSVNKDCRSGICRKWNNKNHLLLHFDRQPLGLGTVGSEISEPDHGYAGADLNNSVTLSRCNLSKEEIFCYLPRWWNWLSFLEKLIYVVFCWTPVNKAISFRQVKYQ